MRALGRRTRSARPQPRKPAHTIPAIRRRLGAVDTDHLARDHPSRFLPAAQPRDPAPDAGQPPAAGPSGLGRGNRLAAGSLAAGVLGAQTARRRPAGSARPAADAVVRGAVIRAAGSGGQIAVVVGSVGAEQRYSVCAV